MPRLVHLDHIGSRKQRPARETLPPWKPGKSAKAILSLLLDYRYLTTELIGILYAAKLGKGQENVRHQVTKLWRYGYIERFYRPAEPRTGSMQYVCTVSTTGARVITSRKEWGRIRRHVYNATRKRSEYEHAIACSLVHILWDLGSQQFGEQFSTVSFWSDNDRVRSVREARRQNSFPVTLAKQRKIINPDATVLIKTVAPSGQFSHRPIFFEVERTHKNKEKVGGRFLHYAKLLASRNAADVRQVFQRELGIRTEGGIAIYIAASRRYAKALRALAAETFGKQPGRRVIPYIWFTSIEDLFEDRNGREEIIPPQEFFTRKILTAVVPSSTRRSILEVLQGK